MKLGMKFTHILIVVRGKFHLISPINKNFSLITTFCIEKFEVAWLIHRDIYIVTKSIITQKRLNFLHFFLLLCNLICLLHNFFDKCVNGTLNLYMFVSLYYINSSYIVYFSTTNTVTLTAVGNWLHRCSNHLLLL